MIESALNSGFLSMGIDSVLLGPIPTPVVSFMTKFLKADAGIMISASHNPFYDNGIKVFLRNGEKLNDKQEISIEKIIIKKQKLNFCSPKVIGRIINYESNFQEYIINIKKVIPKKLDFSNLKMVLDCSNGAAYKLAPSIFSQLGINLITLADCPDGQNINKNCGSLSTNTLSKKVISSKADIGVSFDGDGDRLVICDDNGKIIDGDQILALVSKSLLRQKKLKNECIVSTQMSNLGLERFLSKLGIKLFKSKVGDRYVTEMMRKKRTNLGGEQSGHIIFSDFSSTGDAILSAIQVLVILEIENKSISKLLQDFKKVPQKLINLKMLNNPDNILNNKKLRQLLVNYRTILNNKGNLLVRKSGTENLLRIMIQCDDKKIIKKFFIDIKNCINEIEIKLKEKRI